MSPEEYDVGPFVQENSRHRAQPTDLCYSSDDEVSHTQKNAKKAYRKRPKRSKKFMDSLKMAKRAKINLLDVHHVSHNKKIFELDHYGQIRLTEISETVSCNCTYASGSNVCLHVIWVMMNILNVNEHDEVLHQKSHTPQTVERLFSTRMAQQQVRQSQILFCLCLCPYL